MIGAARDAFERQFANGRFLVMVYPEHPAGPSPHAIVPYLEEAGVKCLDYSGLIDLNQDGYLIPVDLHPMGEAHAKVASQLASDLPLSQSAPQP